MDCRPGAQGAAEWIAKWLVLQSLADYSTSFIFSQEYEEGIEWIINVQSG
jgi:hypothetical protein